MLPMSMLERSDTGVTHGNPPAAMISFCESIHVTFMKAKRCMCVRLRRRFGKTEMARARKSSGVIAGAGSLTGTAYRVIGPDGLERSMTNLSDWIVAVRSGAVKSGSLFLDDETQRWRPVADLDIFDEATLVLAREGSGGASKYDGSDVESGPSAIQESGSGSEELAKQARNSALIWASLAVVALIAFAAWAAGSAPLATVQTLIQRTPEPVRVAGAAVLFVTVAEEFYWFCLKLVKAGKTSLVRRFALQILSLLTTGTFLYLVSTLASTGGSSVPLLTKNIALVGVAYAVSLFVWSILLLGGTDATATKKMVASILASVMLAGTFYMAITPSMHREAQTEKALGTQDRR